MTESRFEHRVGPVVSTLRRDSACCYHQPPVLVSLPGGFVVSELPYPGKHIGLGITLYHQMGRLGVPIAAVYAGICVALRLITMREVRSVLGRT